MYARQYSGLLCFYVVFWCGLFLYTFLSHFCFLTSISHFKPSGREGSRSYCVSREQRAPTPNRAPLFFSFQVTLIYSCLLRSIGFSRLTLWFHRQLCPSFFFRVLVRAVGTYDDLNDRSNDCISVDIWSTLSQFRDLQNTEDSRSSVVLLSIAHQFHACCTAM